MIVQGPHGRKEKEQDFCEVPGKSRGRGHGRGSPDPRRSHQKERSRTCLCLSEPCPPPHLPSSSARTAFKYTRFLFVVSIKMSPFPPELPAGPPAVPACACRRWPVCRPPKGSGAGERRLGQGHQMPPEWTKGLKAPCPSASQDPAPHVPVGGDPGLPPRHRRGLPSESACRPRRVCTGRVEAVTVLQ